MHSVAFLLLAQVLSGTYSGVMPRVIKRPASVNQHELDGDLHRHLVQCGTKTGLIAALQALMTAGWMKDDAMSLNTASVKRRMSTAQTKHTDAATPYGPVCQEIDIGVPSFGRWRICHPLALIWYLAHISTVFANMMSECNVDGVANRLILYIDEVCPGNLLRPEKSRTLQAIYWGFLEWPQHVLQRTAAWPVFGTLRSKVVDKIAGGVSGLMALILRVFFATIGP